MKKSKNCEGCKYFEFNEMNSIICGDCVSMSNYDLEEIDED